MHLASVNGMEKKALSTVTSDRRPNFRLEQLKFQRSRRSELEYAKRLRAVAKQVGHIIKGFAPQGKVLDMAALQKALDDYSKLIGPWAKAVANTMLQDLKRRDLSMWHDLGKDIGKQLSKELKDEPTGYLIRQALEAQVELITSLPREAGQRVHKLTVEGLADSTRAAEIAKEILRSGEVTESRATLIARTEVARTASELTKTRANRIGCTHYIWRTAEDDDVRESHKKMNGKVVAFETPPTLSDGTVTHAGQIYNCRCYIEPILPEEY